MRVNVYAEEMTDRVEIISKTIDGQEFTGLRFYLELPVTTRKESTTKGIDSVETTTIHTEIRGPFIHHAGDDDSSAVTFWGKKDMRDLLRKALAILDAHYEEDRE